MSGRGEPEDHLLACARELQEGVRTEANSRRIFEHYYPWVRGFFSRRGHSPEAAEDLAQETFLRVFREIDSFRGHSSFDSWLFAVAANLLRNERRRRGRQKRDAPELSMDEPAAPGEPPRHQIAAGEASPARQAYERERREALARAVERLPPQMRQCLALRLDQELKYREIARLLKISIQTVKSHLFQARQRLGEELGEEFSAWED